MVVSMHIYRGYPGSGISTEARINADLAGGVVIERNVIRFMLFGKYWGLKRKQEETVTLTQHAIITGAMKHGSNVHIADTNLNIATIKSLVKLGQDMGARIAIHDITTPIHECIARDLQRKQEGGRYLGGHAIRKFGERYPMPWPAVLSMNYNEETDKVELVKH
jgi:predicted kinase